MGLYGLYAICKIIFFKFYIFKYFCMMFENGESIFNLEYIILILLHFLVEIR